MPLSLKHLDAYQRAVAQFLLEHLSSFAQQEQYRITCFDMVVAFSFWTKNNTPPGVTITEVDSATRFGMTLPKIIPRHAFRRSQIIVPPGRNVNHYVFTHIAEIVTELESVLRQGTPYERNRDNLNATVKRLAAEVQTLQHRMVVLEQLINKG